ncbi:hypothetical protein Y032_0088g2145 [Ancylostoma ceylanicum]|uniref:III protein, CoA-transferase family n=1 Tax=Ancylostoma ceylanicum TaxID=53326 RepID=A0A016TNT8_9BILA|nr:hypothetical protein Y032_0088g2145 [Ancylostoma ceylanicum]
MNRTLLQGVRVIELAGLAPVPHCGMVLADFGASVMLIEKPNDKDDAAMEQRLAGRKTRQGLDLRSSEDRTKLRQLCRDSDVLLDPYRPGVLEKMGLDPVELLEENKGLVVCRLTGYGQTGPLAQEAGHDINYVAITGLLPTISGHSCHRPTPPVNLLADFAGGGLTAAFGIVAALLKREKNGGHGCIIDCSMSEGLSYLASFVHRYHDIEHLWTQPYAAFSGDCPIYRQVCLLIRLWILQPK